MFYTNLLSKIKRGISYIIQYLSDTLPKSANNMLYKLMSFFKTYQPGTTAVDYNKFDKSYALLKFAIQILVIIFILVILL